MCTWWADNCLLLPRGCHMKVLLNILMGGEIQQLQTEYNILVAAGVTAYTCCPLQGYRQFISQQSPYIHMNNRARQYTCKNIFP